MKKPICRNCGEEQKPKYKHALYCARCDKIIQDKNRKVFTAEERKQLTKANNTITAFFGLGGD